MSTENVPKPKDELEAPSAANAVNPFDPCAIGDTRILSTLVKLHTPEIQISGRVTLKVPFQTMDLNATSIERYLTVHSFDAGTARLFKLPFDIVPTGAEEDYVMSFVTAGSIQAAYNQTVDLINPLVKFQWPGRWGEVSRVVCSCAVLLSPEEAGFWNDSIEQGQGNLKFGVYALDPDQYPSGAGAVVDPTVMNIINRKFGRVANMINSRMQNDGKLSARPVTHDRAFFVLIPNFYEEALTTPLI